MKYVLNRPPMPGTLPDSEENKIVEIHCEGKQISVTGQYGTVECWGWVKYKKPLSLSEVKEYELKPHPDEYDYEDIYVKKYTQNEVQKALAYAETSGKMQVLNALKKKWKISHWMILL